MKTYDFLIKKTKICPRALAESLKNQWFLNIPVKVAFTGHFRVHVPGNQRVKLVKLRLISWLFAPLLMC